jgi:hypothetical protein
VSNRTASEVMTPWENNRTQLMAVRAQVKGRGRPRVATIAIKRPWPIPKRIFGWLVGRIIGGKSISRLPAPRPYETPRQRRQRTASGK